MSRYSKFKERQKNACSLSPNNYICGFEDTCDCNHVYFSTKEIAEKCAEWLDMLEEEKNEA